MSIEKTLNLHIKKPHTKIKDTTLNNTALITLIHKITYDI